MNNLEWLMNSGRAADYKFRDFYVTGNYEKAQVIYNDKDHNKKIVIDEFRLDEIPYFMRGACILRPFQTWLDMEHKERPILQNEERHYLEGVIKPWRKIAAKIGICKSVCSDGVSFSIHIAVTRKNGELNMTCLPLFSPTDEMYEGMKPGKEYALDDLGLFKENGEDDET